MTAVNGDITLLHFSLHKTPKPDKIPHFHLITSGEEIIDVI